MIIGIVGTVSAALPSFLLAGIFISIFYFYLGKIYLASSRELKRFGASISSSSHAHKSAGAHLEPVVRRVRHSLAHLLGLWRVPAGRRDHPRLRRREPLHAQDLRPRRREQQAVLHALCVLFLLSADSHKRLHMLTCSHLRRGRQPLALVPSRRCRRRRLARRRLVRHLRAQDGPGARRLRHVVRHGFRRPCAVDDAHVVAARDAGQLDRARPRVCVLLPRQPLPPCCDLGRST